MKKYIVVTGGQLFNKGAQAMTFITVDEMAKRYPDKEVVVLSNMDARRSEEDKKKYKFRIMGYPKAYQMLLMQSEAGRQLLRFVGGKAAKSFMGLMDQAAAVVDVSGYALGSNWGYKRTVFYLTRIGIARAAGVPVYLMPQSFGPFDYKGILAPLVQRMLRTGLAYPEVIFCREQEGYDLLVHRYGLEQVVKAPDLVLQNRGVDRKYIYRHEPVWEEADIPEGSVAVIPNQKTILYGDQDRLYALYHQLVEELLRQKRRVFLLYHSAEDLTICRDIKEKYFRACADVRVIERELSCLEFDSAVCKFDFVVASRFHAIVHAYRNGVPAVVLGWATKYQELLAMFSQESFQFDVRTRPDEEAVLGSVREMCARHRQIAADIKATLQEIRQGNVYDAVKCRMG